MVLGISSFTYGWAIGTHSEQPSAPMSESNLIAKTTEFRLNCLQIGDNLPIHSFTKARLDSLKKTARHNSIRLEIGARILTKENLSSYINLAGKLHAPLLRFIIDGSDYEPSICTVIEIIKDALPKLKKSNITLGIENHDRFKARELAFIMEEVGSDQVGICLDCVNSMGTGEGLEYVADILVPYTVNLHIKDFKVERLPHKMGFTITGAIAGQGITNVPLLMEKLSKYNRCQSAVLEQWVPFETDEENTIRKEKQWAEASMKYLTSLPYFNSNIKHQASIL